MVIATDPKGTPTEMAADATANASATVEVTISVTAVDEPPIFTAGSSAARVMFDEVTGIDGRRKYRRNNR